MKKYLLIIGIIACTSLMAAHALAGRDFSEVRDDNKIGNINASKNKKLQSLFI